MSSLMYHVNGYKFHTTEWGRGKKTNNIEDCIRGDIGDGESGCYGMVNEILESEYLSEPLKKVVLFSCEWYDPTCSRGTRKYNYYKIIKINNTQRYEKFYPFIIAQNARQVYYLLYLGRCKSN